MRSFFKLVATVVFLAVLAAGGWLFYFSTHAWAPPAQPFDFTVKTGSSLRTIARQLSEADFLPEPHTFWIVGRLLSQDTGIQAGTYRIDQPMTAGELLEKLNRGDVTAVEMAFIEGTTFKQWLAQLKANSRVRSTLGGRSDADIRKAIGFPEGSPEGWFFPDTYRFAPGSTDVDILKKAHAAMKKRLAEAWDARDPATPLASPYEALVLASIIEKETGAASERPLVGSVFVNRLRKPMRLQTDPTVIYGMGAAFDGNIRRKDLTTDTPWNTYTRDGLPPTPIAMPGAASLQAATRPAASEFIYFVGKGDGTHQFSRMLEEHNAAVARYQLKR